MISQCCKKAHDSKIIDMFIDDNNREYFGIDYNEEIKFCPFCGINLTSEVKLRKLQ